MTGAGHEARGGEASEALVDVLDANGVEYLFVMPGDAFPLLEAIAKYEALGKRAPKVVTCLNEITALSAAHGHFMVSGKPQACLFHVDVGLQMAGGMLHNAQRARAGVVMLGGRTPMTFDGSMRGGRVIDLHWFQDRLDLAGVVRPYVKWHYDLHRTEVLAHAVQRAFQIAAAEPAGPVYVSLLRELLLEQTGSFEPLPPERYAPPRAGVPAARDLEQVAELLGRAESPLAIAGYVGRSAEGFHALTRFAEATGIPVASAPHRANLSSESPMCLGPDAGQALAEADVVLLLDVDVPWIPAFNRPSPDATIVQIDVDPVKAAIPLWGFPVDIALEGSTALALPVLQELVVAHGPFDDRRERVATHTRRRREELVAAAEGNSGGSPIGVDFLSHCVAELVDDETIVVDDSTTARAVTSQYMPTRVPGSYFGPMGTSMGWGSGAALGAKLAAPDRTVICLNAEGNFLSGAPEAALWSAAQLRAPFLTVVYDNAQYAAIKLGLMHEYPDSHSARGGFSGLDLPDLPDLAGIARACGAHGERVEEPADVRPALGRALDAVRGGQAALVDVRVAGL